MKIKPALLVVIAFITGITLHGQIIHTYTTENSDLPSNTVSTILIDTFGVVWLGTDEGVARINDEVWEIINSDGDLIENTVHDMEYERSVSDYIIWVGTNGGVNALLFDDTGVLSSEEYTTQSSELMNDTVVAVGVDLIHNKWFGTPLGISVFNGAVWDTVLSFWDGYPDSLYYFADVPIRDISTWHDTIAYIATDGGGVARFSYNDIDGFTGATTYDNWWAQVESVDVYTTYFKDSSQYFGTAAGAVRHDSVDIKPGWYPYVELRNLFRVQSILVDDEGVIWFGTNNGVLTYDTVEWRHYNMEHGLVYKSINDMKLDADGHVWIATNGGVQVVDTLPSTDLPDPAAINLIESSTTEFYAFINPVTRHLEVSIDFTSDDRISMVLYNLSAQQQLVLENNRYVNSGKNYMSYNLGNYTPGIYLVKMISRNGEFSRKLLLIE